MIRYVSSFSVKTLHGMVNRGLLEMLCRAFPGDKVTVYSPKSSVEGLKEAVKELGNEVVFRKVTVNGGESRRALAWRYVVSAFHNVRVLLQSKKGDTIFYNFNNVFSTSLLNFISRKLRRNRKIVIVCHSELEYLSVDNPHTLFYKRIMTGLTKKFFQRRNTRNLSPFINFIVLGDSIKEELAKYLDVTMLERFRAVDHPIAPEGNPGEFVAGGSPSRCVTVGTVGIMNRFKGSGTYIKLIGRLRDNAEVRFAIAGQIQSDVEIFRRLGVRMSDNPAKALSDHKFSKMVKSLDYILLLYSSDTYRLTASGALLDTIRYHKPLIALKTPYFEYFFQKFGEVGILVDTVEELEERLRSSDLPGPSEYNYDAILRKLTPEALAPSLREAMGE